ncbi:hypothetical protein EFQ76_24060 [Salmonella enterica subsp. enterica]|jgi:hypothetical protein|uniref:Uncharacterized protein n=1 Tax=Anaerotruncus colihominis TaxID=169435 RepID=A0A1Y4MKZ2_9FIRM|nr:hypothetical protein [Anaerotruncus colihominis]EAB7883602.1 hypothetical protein [Salmonella enterica subsp. enterica serovar Enteritidis]OUP65207.1 hypothetical protein B5F11_19895 [Anaerotruncus colihominis]OUP69396.1 hypothetical protein B5F10_19930 [Anaerotruncus colihominis]
MSKLEERESRRKSIVGNMIESSSSEGSGSGMRGRPKEERELKKRISLSVQPSLYDDIQKIAYVQRKSVSEIICSLMEQYRNENQKDLEEYENVRSI